MHSAQIFFCMFKILEVGEPEILHSNRSPIVERDEVAATIRVKGKVRKDSSREVNVSAITSKIADVNFLQLIKVKTDAGELLAFKKCESPTPGALRVSFHDHGNKSTSQATISSKGLVERLFIFYGVRIPHDPDSSVTLRLKLEQVTPGLFVMWKKY